MKDDAERLVRELRLEWPTLRVQLDVFDSGGFMLDVFSGERHFQLAYYPSQKLIGVDEIREEDSFTYYYRFTSTDFAPAAAELRRIVNATLLMSNGQRSESEPKDVVRS